MFVSTLMKLQLRDKMNPQVNYITKTLCDNGFKAHIVGGAVRDILLGKEPHDIDLVTNATPQEIIPLFPNDKVDLVGESFNVVIINGTEIASYRTDSYTDSYELAGTNQASTLEEDLSRRDLTINSLALCPISGNIIDLFDGRTDLNNRTIRFVGNPIDRIKEDPCRILRACRFAAKIGGEFEEETLNALRNKSILIKSIAPERIRIEIMKAMETKHASLFFDKLYQIYGLDFIFPTLTNCYGLYGGKYHSEDVGLHCMIAGDSISTKYPLLKLAGYLHDTGKYPTCDMDEEGEVSFHQHEKVGAEIVRQELKDLKFSNDEIKYVSDIVYYHMRQIRDASPNAIRRLISDIRKDNACHNDLIRIRIADRAGNLAKENHTIAEIKQMILAFETEFLRAENSAFSIKDLTINGEDVMKSLNIGPGKEVGRVLKVLFEMVLEYPELNERERLIEIVGEMK